jgi:hypothetical protein
MNSLVAVNSIQTSDPQPYCILAPSTDLYWPASLKALSSQVLLPPTALVQGKKQAGIGTQTEETRLS